MDSFATLSVMPGIVSTILQSCCEGRWSFKQLGYRKGSYLASNFHDAYKKRETYYRKWSLQLDGRAC